MRRSTVLEQIAKDLQAMSAESDEIGRIFSGRHGIGLIDFRALVHVMVAEAAGTPLVHGELSQRIGVSGPATTYLVDRMVASGHIRRERHPIDRRKVTLHFGEHGASVAQSFFGPLTERTRAALRGVPVSNLTIAHDVFQALIAAMREFNEDLRASEPQVD